MISTLGQESIPKGGHTHWDLGSSFSRWLEPMGIPLAHASKAPLGLVPREKERDVTFTCHTLPAS